MRQRGLLCARSQIFTGYGIFRRFNKVPLSSFVPAVLYRVYNRLRGGIILTSHGSLYFNLNRDVRNKDKAIKEQTLFFFIYSLSLFRAEQHNDVLHITGRPFEMHFIKK